MGIIYSKTLKCENCGYEYQGKGGGHIIANGEHYGIAQYYCDTCHTIVDLECYSSLRENVEKYIYPDGTEFSYDIVKYNDEYNLVHTLYDQPDEPVNTLPVCQQCGKRMSKFMIERGEYANCPDCGHKSLTQVEIHVIGYVD